MESNVGVYQNMANKLTKYRIMIIAAVLLVAMAFAGAASATDVSSREDYLATFGNPTLDAGSYYIKGSWEIPSLHNGSDTLTLNGNVVLDFTNFTGTFAGITDAGIANVAALFGNLALGANNYNIIINGLNMSCVIVSSPGYNNVGGILGNAAGDSGEIRFNNCHLDNISIFGKSEIGGILGISPSGNLDVYFDNCSVEHSEVVGAGSDVGGFIGDISAITHIEKGCTVMNCAIKTSNNCVGGISGDAGTIDFNGTVTDKIRVENTVICTGAGMDWAGGLIGAIWTKATSCNNCTVKNCIIGGMVGDANFNGGLIGRMNGNTATFGINDCVVENTTICAGTAIGGMIGNIGGSDISGRCSNNKVLNIGVKSGSAASSKLIVGNKDWTLGCDTSQGINYLAPPDTICLKNATGADCTLNAATIWKEISYTTGLKSGSSNPATIITNLGQYSKSGGYGVVLYTVSIDMSQNGTIVSVPKVATPNKLITVMGIPNAGYHLGSAYWCETGAYTKNPIQVSDNIGSFSIPAHDVIVNGTFLENVTTVTFYNDSLDGSDRVVKSNTYGKPADVLGNLEKAGYTFNGWNATVDAGVNWWDFSNNESFVKTPGNIWNYTGADGGALAVVANWTVNTTNVTASGNVAEFGNENFTAIVSTSGIVVKSLLENVSQVTDTAVSFIADNTSVGEIPDITGYTKDQISIFEINATAVSLPARFNMTVTFKDEATATADKGKIHFWHYNTTIMDWDTPDLTIAAMVQTGEKVLYTVETYAFSPFGFGIYTPLTPQYTPSSSSKQSGYTVILQEGQVAPTQAPTAAPTTVPTDKPVTPTVVPTANPTTTPKTPAPVVGLVLGLGAAAVLLRLRK